MPHITTNLSEVGTVAVPSINAFPLLACRNKARSQPFLPSSVGRASAPPVAVKGSDAS